MAIEPFGLQGLRSVQCNPSDRANLVALCVLLVLHKAADNPSRSLQACFNPETKRGARFAKAVKAEM